jgi:hypothetical protein
MKYTLITLLFIAPFLCIGQKAKTVTPSDSLAKYQKLALRDRDSLKKYEKKPGWNEHYSKLWDKRQGQVSHWADLIYYAQRRKKS